jgi:hypothetical protein
MKIDISNLGVYELTVANFLALIAASVVSVILSIPAFWLIYQVFTSTGIVTKVMHAIIAGSLFSIAGLLLGASLSMIQLLLVKNHLPSIVRWIGFNSLLGLAYIVVTIAAGNFSLSIANYTGGDGHLNQLVLPLFGGITGAMSGSIIAAGHWSILSATIDVKRKWSASIVLSSFAIMSLLAYAVQFMSLAK